jgi:hypothetical protein
MMEYFLAAEPPRVQARAGVILIDRGVRRWEPSEFAAEFGWLDGFLARVPRHVRAARLPESEHPHDPVLNPAGDISYTNYVANKMEHGQLAVCGVTKDFTYGANVPCTSVLVDKDFLLKHSANTLRQFIGRVARTGLAPFGIAQFEDDAFLEKMCGKNNQEEALCMEATAKAICKLVDAGEELS